MALLYTEFRQYKILCLSANLYGKVYALFTAIGYDISVSYTETGSSSFRHACETPSLGSVAYTVFVYFLRFYPLARFYFLSVLIR